MDPPQKKNYQHREQHFYKNYYEYQQDQKKPQPPQIRHKKHKLGKKLKRNQDLLENELIPEIEKCKAMIQQLVDSQGNKEEMQRQKMEIEKDLKKMMYRAENKYMHLIDQERQMREIHCQFPSNQEHDFKYQSRYQKYF